MIVGNEWWRGCVIYQIYPRSFQDDNGDGLGDLKGITRRLPHVADLGVDAIWLSPFFKSPMADMGYDVLDYTDVAPEFGVLSDFDELVTTAHDLGLKVIIDQVLSHSSDQHPFFQESRSSRENSKADWYVWADSQIDGTPPNNWMAIFNGGPAWEWEPRRQQFYLHNFLREQPDFNFHNPEVQDWALSVMKFWLDRGVDGFRLDTANFYFHDKKLRNNPASYLPQPETVGRLYDMQYHLFSKSQPENIPFLEKMRTLVDQYDAKMLIGEIGDNHRGLQLQAEYTSGNRLHMAYSFELLGGEFTPAYIRSNIEAFFSTAPDGWPCWAFSNHDVQRHVTRWGLSSVDVDDLALVTAAALLSLPGSICLFQGEELGQTETQLQYSELTDPQGINYWPADKGRDGCRTPMVWDNTENNAGFSKAEKTWLPIKNEQASRAVNLQLGDASSVLETYRKLLHFRSNSEDLKGREFGFLDLGQSIMGLTRGKSTICVFNTSKHRQSVPVPELSRIHLSRGAELASGQLALEAYGWVLGER